MKYPLFNITYRKSGICLMRFDGRGFRCRNEITWLRALRRWIYVSVLVAHR
ncbi:hypothetical protein PUN28_017477 [Cardiocondyla obscurior]|uniref:Uncharacterized protein n=1 Tax=Cardiocondyla obscurior TaxID=286306 RepID=A0AAW2EIZ9_9HYME